MDKVYIIVLNVREGRYFGGYLEIAVSETIEFARSIYEEYKNNYIQEFKESYNEDYFSIYEKGDSFEIHSEEYEDLVEIYIDEKKVLK